MVNNINDDDIRIFSDKAGFSRRLYAVFPGFRVSSRYDDLANRYISVEDDFIIAEDGVLLLFHNVYPPYLN